MLFDDTMKERERERERESSERVKTIDRKKRVQRERKEDYDLKWIGERKKNEISIHFIFFLPFFPYLYPMEEE